MKNLILSVVAGLFFGLWPLLMQRSNLSPFLSAAVFSSLSLLIVGVGALTQSKDSLYTANWKFALLGGIAGGVGLIAFNLLLTSSTPKEFSSWFIMTLLVQVAVPSIFFIILTREIKWKGFVGIVATVTAIVSFSTMNNTPEPSTDGGITVTTNEHVAK